MTERDDRAPTPRAPTTPIPQRLEALVLDELRGAILAALSSVNEHLTQRIITMENTISSGFLAAAEAQRQTSEQIRIAAESDAQRAAAAIEQGRSQQASLDGLLRFGELSEQREGRREMREAEDRARQIAREEEDRQIALARAAEDRSIEVSDRKHRIEAAHQVRAAVVKAIVGVITALGALVLAWLALRG